MSIPEDPHRLTIQRFTRDYVHTAKRNDHLVRVVSVLILSHMIRHLEINCPSSPGSTAYNATLEEPIIQYNLHRDWSGSSLENQFGPGLVRLQNLVRRAFESQGAETVWENLMTWLIDHLILQALQEREGQQPPQSVSQAGSLTASKAWLEGRIDRLFTIYSRGLARTVVQALDLYSLTEAQLRDLIEFRQADSQAYGSFLSYVPLLIPPPGMFPSHPMVQSLVASLQAVGTEGWTNMSTRAVWHQYREGRKARIDVFYHPGSALEQDPLWEHACRHNDLVADVLLLMLSHWAFQAKAPDAAVWISIDSVLKYRGIKPKLKHGQTAGYRFEERELISRSITFLHRLTIQVQGLTIYPVKEKPGPLTLAGSVLQVEDTLCRNSLAATRQTAAVKYHPGQIGRFLYGDYRIQMAFMPQQLFFYDYYRQKWEKRLGRYLFFQWAIRKNHGNLERPWRVRTILENLQQYPDINRPERTRKRLEKALERMQTDGIIAFWHYSDGDDQSLPAHRWIDTWMQWKLHIAPPAILSKVYHSSRTR